jgi:hypothetical protein
MGCEKHSLDIYKETLGIADSTLILRTNTQDLIFAAGFNGKFCHPRADREKESGRTWRDKYFGPICQ